MGREYALLSGEDNVVAYGIFEHYLPRFAEDSLPKTSAGKIVSLADKIDTITGCFGLGKIPTGSVDPYGLRRAANGIIRIIVENKLELLLDEVFAYALKSYVDILKDVQFEKVYKQIIEFIGGRLRAMLLEEGISHDVIEAAFYNISDLLFVCDIAKVLQTLKSRDKILGVVKTHDRIFRISKPATREQVLEHDLEDEAEKKLFELYLTVNWEVEEKVNRGDYEATVLELSKLTDPVEEFFDKVLVMHNDERIKVNRLALLKTLDNLFLKVADFKRIVV